MTYSVSFPQKAIRFTLTFILIIVISQFLGSCSKPDEENTISVQTEVSLSAYESEVLILINNHREAIGLPKLTPLTPIYSEALKHTKYMIEQGRVCHDGFNERCSILMNTIQAKVVLENVAAGYKNPDELFSAFLNSEEHRKNIENPDIQYMGISDLINSSGNTYVTQIFVGK